MSKTGEIWPYLKVECAPPMSLAILNGPVGQKMEGVVTGVANNIIGIIEKQRNAIDAAEERAKQAKEAAIKAALEKAKAEELLKKQEAEKKATEAKLAKDKEEAAKQAEEAAEKGKKDKKDPKSDSKKK